jgi:hypothetical protein
MHCPSCGQEQVSANTKFCSRCGFQLDLVGELLANGGFLPQLAQLAGNKSFFNKKNGVMFAVLWFFFFVFFLTPIGGIIDSEEMAAISAVTGIFGSILILIFSLAFLPSSKAAAATRFVSPDSIPRGLYGKPQQQQLPPEQFQPANVYTAPQGNWRAPDTGELATPGTVTENTTKLLSKEENR